ncbi:MAG: alpha-2-macroglobulin family protein [Nibricoccus sp.]
MKIRPSYGIVAFLCFAFAVALAGPRDAQWKEVDQAIHGSLPKTAIEKLEPIIAAALADKSYAEAIKAIGQKIAQEGVIQGNKAEERIVRFEAEMAKAPPAMKPVMEAVLAHWYWSYFQQNRWRFMQRTRTAEAPGADIQTWDLARILSEVDKHFEAALAAERVLKAEPVSAYDDLLVKGGLPDVYRPTMYDFIAHEALSFYQAGENGGVHAEDEFEIDVDGPIFDDSEKFLSWSLPADDSNAPKLKALQLYQALLRFHKADADRTAFFDVELARLEYGKNAAVGEERAERYKSALRRLIENAVKNEVSAAGLAALAQQLQTEGEPAQAHETAELGRKKFPGSVGGTRCYNLIQQLEAKAATLNTERVWNAPWPTLDVSYRNITQLHFRVIPLDFEEYISKNRWNYGGLEHDYLTKKLAQAPVLAWRAELPATPDFKMRTEKLPAPSSLKPGYYLIAASHDSQFNSVDNLVAVTTVWVSDLALVLRTRYDQDEQSGLVVRAGSGEPVSGATVQVWRRNNNGWFKQIDNMETDSNGRFAFSAKNETLFFLAESDGQRVSSANETYAYRVNKPDSADTQTVFFTDRALYRPGQTIYYKGVSIRYDQDAGKYSALADREITVLFNDPNGKEIARATHRTNDYGSFNGVFTAPRDRVMGRMTIQVAGRPSQTSVSVEEYKRPKFQVELNPPVEAAKLDASVVVKGKATAYTGAAVGGAKVKWHVQRGVQLPYWCWWWQPPASKAIAHGTAVTEPDGTFKVEFTAVPDRGVPVKNEPVFNFMIHVDVTDTTGETRSDDQTVRAAYTALQANLSAAQWQTPDQPVQFNLATTSLDGTPQAASGTLKIHALKQPESVARPALQQANYWWSSEEPKVDDTKPESWSLGDVVAENAVAIDASGKTQLGVPLKAGIYRALFVTKDRFGKEVTARATVQVVDPGAKNLRVKIPNLFQTAKTSIEPGETCQVLWGTGYSTGRALVEIECNGKELQSYWTAADRTQQVVSQLVSEHMRGGFTVRVTYVRENRAYFNQMLVDVSWSNKKLSLKWESFRSKLQPGQKETWTAVVTGPDAKKSAAEMVATLYDASLDQYLSHYWPQGFYVFRHETWPNQNSFQNNLLNFQFVNHWSPPAFRSMDGSYRQFDQGLFITYDDDDMIKLGAFKVSAAKEGSARAIAAAPPAMMMKQVVAADAFGGKAEGNLSGFAMEASALGDKAPGGPSAQPDLSKITARKNLNETAFFFPQLTADDDGMVRMTFTMPETLTEWKFFGFAHDAQLRSGFLTDKVVTAKDLMVEPNPPRFVREGDTIEFTVKVSNQSDQPQKGAVKLTFADAATLKAVDDVLGNKATEQPFDVPAKQSRSYSWRIAVPDGLGFVTYKAVAASSQFSDGEEGFLPVLSRRILVTESLPLPIRGKSTKTFAFAKLLASGKSDSLRHQSLTVQMTSQPAWYAVMALPYLMEYPYECSEQIFNRLYANALARHIANTDPKIRRIFDQWKNTPALDSPLQKNQDLKAVMIEETPWYGQAKRESEARRDVGVLFDGNRLDDETTRTLRKLSERQISDGLWSWFPGGRPSEYISLYIVTGFGRLRHLGVEMDVAPAIKALDGLDVWMDKEYREIQRTMKTPEQYVPSYTDALYLYGRSFFLKDRPIASQYKKAVDFFLGQSRKFWVDVSSRQSQAHLALALQRFGDKETPTPIMKSLKERSVSSEELGMFWRDTEFSWWWYHAPIETQALMIEAFAEVANDMKAVEDCKVWLLKQKQTQNWKTTKATADAIYGLLVRGDNLLASDALVEVSLGGETIKPEKVEAGTGFYEQKFAAAEIKPAMGNVKVTKTDAGVSWGSVHWQYLEDMAKVTPHEGTPLKLKKTLWTKETTSKGQVLKPVKGAVSVGDELVVRIELRTDRDMEYVHLKDQRGSGTEPVNVLSRYKYQDGLGYYESTRDTASHFFIDYLPKGVYVFEYSVRVQLKGNYQTGIAEIQCMYAPEFNSHSESIPLEVK